MCRSCETVTTTAGVCFRGSVESSSVLLSVSGLSGFSKLVNI